MKRGVVIGGFSLGFLVFALGVGCGDDGEAQSAGSGDPGTTGSGASGGTGGTGGTGGMGVGGSSTGGGGSGGGSNSSGVTCMTPPPAGATLAPPPPAYSGGTCPALVEGFNGIMTGGNARMFRLVLPKDLDPAEKLPILFLWHWLGGSADDFYTRGDVQNAADTQRFIAVIPESKDDVLFKWPFEATQSDTRVEEEFVFFDDMLSCVSEQFNVNKECVSSAGVSAGALFTDQLAGGRGQYLSSILSLSGGVGGLIRPWTQPDHRMPAMVLWGGPSDTCFSVMNFESASHTLEDNLTDGGHFFLECIHNCGHAAPPLDVPPGTSTFAPLWDFALSHPYWLKPGDSPYAADGIPSLLPTWCGIGKGSAVPRTGPCPEPPGC